MSENESPIGIMPKNIWEMLRAKHLIEAMKRFSDAGKPTPPEWIEELAERIHIGLWERGK